MQVDFLVRDNKPYTYENFACLKLRRQFENFGIKCRKIPLGEGVFQDYLALVQEDPPHWILSFEELFFLQKPFCDIIKIPYLYWKNGLVSTALPYFSSQYGFVGCIDRALALHFDHPFLPHATDDLQDNQERRKIFDVVLFQDLIDLEGKKKTWQILFHEKGVRTLIEALEACKKNPQQHPAIIAKNFPCEHIHPSDFVSELEEYLRAERTVELVESLQNVSIHLFGDHAGNNWLLRLKNRRNVHLHGPLPYAEQFEVLKLARVLVRDQPPFSHGSDEWMLHAWSCGCFAFTNPNPYLLDILQGVDCFYHSYEELNEKIRRSLEIKNISFFPEETLKKHSWQKRASEMIEFMSKKTDVL